MSEQTVTPESESPQESEVPTESTEDSTGISDESTDEPTGPPVATLENLDNIRKAFVEEATTQVNQYNAKVAEKSQKFGTFEEAEDGIYESSEDADIKAANTALERLRAKEAEILEQRKSRAQEIFTESRGEGSEDEEKALVAEIETMNDEVKTSVQYLKKWLDQNGYAVNKSLEKLLPPIAGVKTGGDGRGQGIPKLRGFLVLVDGVPATMTTAKGKVSNFSAAGTRMGVPANVVQKAYFEYIGTTEKEKFPAEATFTVKGKDKEYTVTARRVDGETSE